MKLSASIRAGSTGLPSRASGLDILAVAQGIPMTVPSKYSFIKPARNCGRTAASEAAYSELVKLEKARHKEASSRREKKQHKLKGLRP